MKVDVLAIAAHRDDIELTCGGTLIKMKDLGYVTGIVELTEGEMGTRGSAEEREQEAMKAAEVLGVSIRENVKLLDAKLELNMESKLRVAQKIRDFKPRVALIPYWEARHPDHYTAGKIAYEACFIAGLQKMDLLGEAHRPYKILYSTLYATSVTPSLVVDITKQFDQRLAAILCYKSQFSDTRAGGEVFPPLDNLIEQIHASCRFYGNMVGVKYGEPYYVKEPFRGEDLVKLAGRSI
ncbi:MAG: bacillithiol biosynthesis deacetylase BshB1 [Acidobacteria bacterium]|nr:bacillithiol biosynthesis deacetylase BshB1 [Acidobacteriota bacterium]MBI3655921.1 bacillithiol biosynthesis deacetylase BshB1 [Acidobacteriota bacterium]